MKKHIILIGTLTASLCGCATTSTSKLSYTPEVRKMSSAGSTLFLDVLSGMGGVGFADEVFFPSAKERRITGIDRIVPYGNGKTGVERWTVQHDGRDTCSYIVTFTPDEHGGTTFSVQRDDGTTKPASQQGFGVPTRLAVGNGNDSTYTKSRADRVEFTKLCESAGEKVFRTAPAARSVYLQVDYFDTYTEVKNGSYQGRLVTAVWFAAEDFLRSTALDFVEFHPETDDDGVGAAAAAKLQRLLRGGSIEDGLTAATADIGVYGNTLVQYAGDARHDDQLEGYQLIAKDERTGEVLATLRYFVDTARRRICGFSGFGGVSDEAFIRRVLGGS